MKLLAIIVPVYNEGSFGFGSLVDLALDGIVGHSILPLRLASFVGVSFSIFAVFAVAIYFVLWLTYEKTWPAGFATLAILVLISMAAGIVFSIAKTEAHTPEAKNDAL